jgi:sRNA-binding protein
MTAYRFMRDEIEHAITQLAEKYPKCFFEDPKLRRPLKKNIIADLQHDGFGVASELITAGVDWYESHLSYQYALEVGAKRIDLNGKEVGTVTDLEQRSAQKKIKEVREKIAAKNLNNALATNTSLYAAGRITDDQIKKLDAAPMIMPKPTSNGGRSPDLAKLYSALDAANTALTGDADPDLRTALGHRRADRSGQGSHPHYRHSKRWRMK